MTEQTALKIALEVLVEFSKGSDRGYSTVAQIQQAAKRALREIQREHYLDSPSPVIAEVIGAKDL